MVFRDYEEPNHLFAEGPLSRHLAAIKESASREAAAQHADVLLGKDIDDALDSITKHYRLRLPSLGKPEAEVLEHAIRYTVPFTGNAQLFQYRPSQFQTIFPIADLRHDSLIFEFPNAGTADEIKGRLNQELATIDKWLGWIKQDIEMFNSGLEDFIRPILESRKEKVERDQKLREELSS